jgi:hypothetical protein
MESVYLLFTDLRSFVNQKMWEVEGPKLDAKTVIV